MEDLSYKTVFVIPTAYQWGKIPLLAELFPRGLAITETVVISWFIMLILIGFALVATSKKSLVPVGLQSLSEAAVEALNTFAKNQFGRWARFLGPYMGTLFLFLLLANIIGFLTPVEFSFLGHEYKAPFAIKPPTRDINVTAPLAVITVLFTLFFGFASKGPLGWLKKLTYPVPFMLPFNIMEYGTRLLSLSLRLFGNILGGMILMILITGLEPLGLPALFSLYFDFFDGILQAAIFVFLSVLYISEACEVEKA
ncbi:MAG: F0F1 ATP synthase subunit A [Spirochaetaceae bacterium]|jgi:F-type H+-transporting ATPase subunit a|nr:F0F1 ATP synthase subunit A [Spirochaetaceae bacterium]